MCELCHGIPHYILPTMRCHWNTEVDKCVFIKDVMPRARFGEIL